MPLAASEAWTARTALLLGQEGVDRLAAASVAVFGLGGVGSYAAEALARAGVGRLILGDGDVVRHVIVQRIIKAYEADEKAHSRSGSTGVFHKRSEGKR